jgi:restriction system protein
VLARARSPATDAPVRQRGPFNTESEVLLPVPDFQTWFLPLLRRVADGQTHKMADLYEQLAMDLGLTPEDRVQLLESGKQSVYENRIGWARTYLKKAGLLEAPGRGLIKITTRGREVLTTPPVKLNVSFLRQYPEFVEFHTYKPDPAAPSIPDEAPGAEAKETPQDTLDRVRKQLHAQLASELLERVKEEPPSFFERLVVDLLVRMGYGGSREDAGRTIGKSGDGGLDGVINEDRLGLDVVYIQAKRWEAPVGRPVVQAFAGSLEGARARKGVLITTSYFTADAEAYVRQIEKRIVLIDGKQLAAFMIQHNVGVSVEATYEVKKLDLDYFEE